LEEATGGLVSREVPASGESAAGDFFEEEGASSRWVRSTAMGSECGPSAVEDSSRDGDAEGRGVARGFWPEPLERGPEALVGAGVRPEGVTSLGPLPLRGVPWGVGIGESVLGATWAINWTICWCVTGLPVEEMNSSSSAESARQSG
jgi:hypothetical protein